MKKSFPSLVPSEDTPHGFSTASVALTRFLSRFVQAMGFFLLLFFPLSGHSQFNVDRLIVSGRVALSYDDYVLGIQYFNRVIALKPYLYQPWLYRGVAKYYLDDYTGAEADVSEALRLNPYVADLYDLRAISRIRQEKYEDAVQDYSQAIKLNPINRNYWFNRAICRLNTKDYDRALAEADTIARQWNTFASVYSLKAEIFLNKKDTTAALHWLDESLKRDSFDANTWTTRAYIFLNRQSWRSADTCLTEAIRLKPNLATNYVNRALVRLNLNKLGGAMTDYDMALDLDSSNFLAHYNRGLLRMQLGDDNRAIEDFNYVIRLEPQNVMAIFNRGILRDKTGDLRGAVRDYSTVIDQFPNFWTGLSYRARCYRRMGMTGKAELDEFRILKAQMDKHVGIQNRWSRAKLKEMRRRSEIDPEKYNQIVVADQNEVDHEYQSAYRGKVQNRAVQIEYKPMYGLSFLRPDNKVSHYHPFDNQVDAFNQQRSDNKLLHIVSQNSQLSEKESHTYFDYIETLTQRIQAAASVASVKDDLLLRAVAYSVVLNMESAISDLTAYIQTDSLSSLAYWQRAVCQSKMNNFDALQGADVKLKMAAAIDDLTHAMALAPDNAFICYDRATLYALRGDYEKAVDDYTRALQLDSHLAEAYYNRGIVRIKMNARDAAISDLSKAGELGLYEAYSIIKNSIGNQKSTSKK